MGQATKTIGRPPFPPHEKRGNKAVRVNLLMWEKARQRARKEGYTVQDVVREFTEAYAKGKVDMPKMVKKF